MPLLEVAEDGAVLVLTLNRPEALNAFTIELHGELRAALKGARADDVRAVVVTGAGRAFCAGQDLEETQRQETGPGERLGTYYNPNILALRALEKPVIAAINGVAAGAGLSLALACDIRISSEKASFVPAFSAIGLIPDSGATLFAPQVIGYARAFDWFASNRKLPATEALAWGLVHEIAPADDVLDRALDRARALAAQPGLGVGLTKRLLARVEGATLAEQLEFERHAQQAASEHPDYAATVAAFLAKQPAGARRAAPVP
jgi:2-(1,2-epoxy-1,2-dihydrophenyl)acetyl-CoA isomerase